jgi:hypothetical protein
MGFFPSPKGLARLDLSGTYGWDTRDEVGFLHGLGTHRPLDYRREPLTRKQLLAPYLEAARHRVDWGDMDRDTVVQVARNLLTKEASR